ncbi:MAG: DEAD/DEAH box helicase [Acidimicrobiales bacterium]|nr:DEAD/DEAH box helicase [Acidimicrobiales bacterium]
MATAPVLIPLVQDAVEDGTFAGLGLPASLCAVIARQGLTSPLPIQTATISDALAGRDVLGQAATGSGKTLAFSLPLVTRLAAQAQTGPRRPRALVVAPTRELASQIDAVIKPLAAAVGMRTATVFGGVGAGPQISALRAGTEIIIGCPGRLLDLYEHRALDLRGIEVSVIDEADHLADIGFLPAVTKLLEATPQTGQRLLFSATLSGPVDVLVRRFLHDPVSHTVSEGAAPDMEHQVMVVDATLRLGALLQKVGKNRAVIFTRTKHRARQLTRTLNTQGLHAVELHGNLSQGARSANLRAFSTGAAQVLVATDIAARGIHVDEVPLVVHADPPLEHRAYLHRSGRTARAGAAGTVVTLAMPEQIDDVKALLRRAELTATWMDHHGTTLAPALSAARSGVRSGSGSGSPAPAGGRPRRSGPPRRTRRG